MKFDLEDMRQFADRHRGKYVTSGPHWSTIMRFPVLFDEYEKSVARAEAAESALNAALAENEQLEIENARYEKALVEINNWAQAYPLDIFPEPDFAVVNEVLKAAGISLSCVSASNMRHVITRVEKITESALKGGEK